MTDLFASSSAVLSACGTYRYRLERQCPGVGKTLVVMVNPSTADAETDDQTIRKLLGFGARHQWGRLIVGNLFAFRAKDIRALDAAADPIGPDNDAMLYRMMSEADRLIFAWGALAKLPERLRRRWSVIDCLAQNAGKGPLCLGTTGEGKPCHPLTLGYATPLTAWSAPA